MNASGAPAAISKRLGAIALIGLLAVSLVLGIFVYRARTPDLALEVTSFPKTFGNRAFAEIIFFVRLPDDNAKVEIVGRDKVVTRTLADSIALDSDQRVRCLWDGLDDGGEKAPPGRYRLRVTLPGEGREMVFPKRLDIEPGQYAGYAFTLSEPCEPQEGSE